MISILYHKRLLSVTLVVRAIDSFHTLTLSPLTKCPILPSASVSANDSTTTTTQWNLPAHPYVVSSVPSVCR